MASGRSPNLSGTDSAGATALRYKAKAYGDWQVPTPDTCK